MHNFNSKKKGSSSSPQAFESGLVGVGVRDNPPSSNPARAEEGTSLKPTFVETRPSEADTLIRARLVLFSLAPNVHEFHYVEPGQEAEWAASIGATSWLTLPRTFDPNYGAKP